MFGPRIARRSTNAELDLVSAQGQKTAFIGGRRRFVGLRMNRCCVQSAGSVHNDDLRCAVEPEVDRLKLVEDLCGILDRAPIAITHAVHDHIQDDFMTGKQIDGLLMNQRDHFGAIVLGGVQYIRSVFPGGTGKRGVGISNPA